MSKKFLYVDVDGLDTEALSYESTDFISTSAGAGDAAKPILTNAGGKIDATFIDSADVAHDSTTGAAASTVHTSFPLLDGTRAYTGIQSYNSHPAFSSDFQMVDKKYVDDQNLNDAWHPFPAISYVVDNTLLPATEVSGDVYVLSHNGGVPHVNYDGAAAGDIVQFNGTLWVATTPIPGTKISVNNETTSVRFWNGTLWQQQFYESSTASLGAQKVGVDIRADIQATSGIKLVGNSMAIEPNDFAGAGLVDDGADNLAIDWSTVFNDAKAIKASDLSSNATGLGASIIGLEDASSFFTSTNVEGALSELFGLIGQSGVDYTVGTGGVTIGDLCYISATNTVLPYSTLSQSHRGIGIALATSVATSTVKVLANDTRISGLTIAGSPIAGDPIYWDGTQLTATMPSGAGSHVWQAGVLAAAGDMHVEVRHVKKNA